MNKEKNPLGRGLDSLLGGNKEKPHQEIHQIKINSLEPSQFQPRSRMHKATLDELAESIKEQGVIQPIVVRKKASGTYEIVVGERRWRAAQSTGGVMSGVWESSCTRGSPETIHFPVTIRSRFTIRSFMWIPVHRTVKIRICPVRYRRSSSRPLKRPRGIDIAVREPWLRIWQV